jgi:hypothetical protein
VTEINTTGEEESLHVEIDGELARLRARKADIDWRIGWLEKLLGEGVVTL